MYSVRDDTALPVPGFPIRVSAGQSLFSSSPRLIAAVHALHRLLVPRHPPCALTILTVIVDVPARAAPATTVIFTYVGLFGQLCSFQGAARAQPGGLPGWSLKTQQCQPASCDAGSRPGRRFRNAGAPKGVRRTRRHPPGRGRCVHGATAGLIELPRKEVIQPHLPVRLPCYDFTPITSPTFDGSLPKVGSPASGVARFRGVTGGVYKARERIHPGVADPGLLATPPSWRRVSASNPNRDRLYGIRSTSRYRSPLYRPM